MKLSDIRGAMRKASGNPTAVVDLGNGVPMTVTFQKTPLLKELGRVFNDERTAETGLSYDPETGMILVESGVKDITESERERIEAENQGWLEESEGADYPDDGSDLDDDEDDLL